MSPIKSLFITAFRDVSARAVATLSGTVAAIVLCGWTAIVFLESPDNDPRSDTEIADAAREQEADVRENAAYAAFQERRKTRETQFKRVASKRHPKLRYAQIKPNVKEESLTIRSEYSGPADESLTDIAALSRTLGSDKRTDIYQSGWGFEMLGQTGTWSIQYDRRRKMLFYHQWGTSTGAGYVGEVYDIYSGVSEEVIHRLARDKKMFADLPRYGCAHRSEGYYEPEPHSKSTPE